MNNLRDKIADIIVADVEWHTDNSVPWRGMQAADAILALPEIAEMINRESVSSDTIHVLRFEVRDLKAKLAKVEAERDEWKGVYEQADRHHMEAERSTKAAEAALPRAYRMGLEDAANVLLDKHTNNVGMVHPITGADCKDIRTLQPPADLAERVKGTDHE